MLKSIHVKNIALIEEAFVEFGEGLNILTGETGAGKSVIIGSAGMALGAKASRDLIRTGADSALVELDFEVRDRQILQELEAMDIPADENHVLLSRRLTEGRSVARINGEVVSVPVLQKAAALLIDIHGQHEHQSLLHEENHIAILDRFAQEDLAGIKPALRAAYQSWTAIRQEMEREKEHAGSYLKEKDYLRFQIDEIDAAALKDGEEEELRTLYRKMSNAREIVSAVSAVSGLTGSSGNDCAGDQISRAIRELSGLERFDPAIEGLREQLEQIESLLYDFGRDLSDYEESLVFDEAVFRETEERLELISRLETKYGQTIADVLAHRDACQASYDKYDHYEQYMEELEQRLSGEEKKLADLTRRVSAIRREKSVVLEKKIVKALEDLNFLGVRFEIRCETLQQCTANGADRVQFLISTNPGEDVRPLAKVASGGELSRIMLAIKSVMADTDSIETLIFDEIDAGISGRTAQKVSEKLALLSGSHQIICITHLPQIASMADRHFVIEKESDGSRTRTQISPLPEEESITELARLLGGARITEAVMDSAGEMRKLALQRKSELLRKIDE